MEEKNETTVKAEASTRCFCNRDVLKWVIVGLAGIVILVLVFGAGMRVGAHKARYSYRWAENYHKNFAGPREGFFNNFTQRFDGKEFMNAHGTFGSIITIDGSTLIIKGKDGIEKNVVVSDTTTIESHRETVKLSDLKIDNQVVIIGAPNEQGQIEAKFIRVF